MALPCGSSTPGLRVMNTRAFIVSPVAWGGGSPMAARFRASKLNPPFTAFRVISFAGYASPGAVKGTPYGRRRNSHVPRFVGLWRHIFRLERPGGADQARAGDQFHPGRRQRLQGEGLS